MPDSPEQDRPGSASPATESRAPRADQTWQCQPRDRDRDRNRTGTAQGHGAHPSSPGTGTGHFCELPFLEGSWSSPWSWIFLPGARVWHPGVTVCWPCPLLTAALTNARQGPAQSLFRGNAMLPHKTFFRVYLNLSFSVTASLGNKHIKALMICTSKERHYSAIINTKQFKILPIFGEELRHSCKQNL